MSVRRIAACVGRSRLVFVPCTACSLRPGVALALEILFFAPLSIVTKQETDKVLQRDTMVRNAQADNNQSRYLLRPRWVPCWSALAALVAGGVV